MENQENKKARYIVSDFPEIWEKIPEDKRHLFIEQEERANRKGNLPTPPEGDAATPHAATTPESDSAPGTTSSIRQQIIDLTLDALRQIKGGGSKNARVTCPICGHKTCDVKRDNGLFHCWRQPDHKGIIHELRSLNHKESSCIDRQYYAHARNQQKKLKKDKGYVPTSTDDYQEISPEVRSRLYPICPFAPEEEEERQAFIQHFHPSNLQVRCPKAQPLLSAPELQHLQSQVRSYLQAMGISPEVAKRERVMCAYTSQRVDDSRREDPQGAEPVPAIAYCNWLSGRIINVKLRTVSLNPLTGEWSKHFEQISPYKPCAPYGIHSLDPLRPGAEPIHQLIFTEGEKDRLTLLTCGFPYVLSIANGAATNIEESHEAFEEWILQAEEIIICGDKDKPGRGLEIQLLDRYKSRAKVVSLPQGMKDISEAYQAFGAHEVRRIISEAQEVDADEVYDLSQHQDEIMRSMMGMDDKGYDVGMGTLTDGIFHPTNEGGLIVLTGIPNSGKTDFLNCLTTHLMYHCQKRIAYFSFELPKKSKHVRNIARIALGVSDTATLDGIATPEEARLENQKALGFLMRHMVDFDTKSRLPDSDNIITMAEQEMRKRGLDYLIIDPYIFVDMTEGGSRATETEKVRLMLTKLQAWSRAKHVWTIIVAHPRIQYKDGHEDFPPLDIYAIAGSAQWANLADFLLTVRRVDKPQEHKVFTLVEMLKVRDQELCHPGKVYYTRQPCGRYDERPDEQACIREHAALEVMEKDDQPWISAS